MADDEFDEFSRQVEVFFGDSFSGLMIEELSKQEISIQFRELSEIRKCKTKSFATRQLTFHTNGPADENFLTMIRKIGLHTFIDADKRELSEIVFAYKILPYLLPNEEGLRRFREIIFIYWLDDATYFDARKTTKEFEDREMTNEIARKKFYDDNDDDDEPFV